MTGQQDRKRLDAGGIIPLLAGVQRKLGPGALAIVRVGDHRMVAEIELVELRAVGELLRRESLGLCAAGETTEEKGDGSRPDRG